MSQATLMDRLSHSKLSSSLVTRYVKVNKPIEGHIEIGTKIKLLITTPGYRISQYYYAVDSVDIENRIKMMPSNSIQANSTNTFLIYLHYINK